MEKKSELSNENLQDRTVKELKNIARNLDLSSYSKKNKGPLINLMHHFL